MGNFKHNIEMKHNRYLLGLALLVAGALPVFSQVSNDNEDEVNKVDQRFARDFVPGQVLVKFKDDNPITVRRVRGKYQSSSISSVDAVLNEFGVKTMDKLLPNEKPKPLGARRRAKAFNGQDVVESDLSQLYIIGIQSLQKDSTLQLVEKLKGLDEVEFAEPNYKVYMLGQVSDIEMTAAAVPPTKPRRVYSTEAVGDVICADPSQNPLFSQQWGLVYEGIPELWTKPIINRKRPVIAILDTGVDITHPDLVDNIWTNLAEAEGEVNYDNDGNGFKGDVHGWDFINNTADIRDYNSHGTHVAGIAAACNNETGIIGANPQALIMPITVMQSDGTGDVATIAKGINYAVQNGATIINMSLGTYGNSNVLRQALAKAYQSAVLVAAAGNDAHGIYFECDLYTYGPMFPAAYEFVLGAQAINKGGSLAGFSNFDCDGPTFSLPGKDRFSDDDGAVNYEMAYPGVDILSTIPDGNYKQYNGTSMAAPLLAGGISALQMVKEYGSQEIFWGDIIHTANLAEAFDITERPAILELVTLEWDDTTDGGNGDGQPDAGETLRLYPKIKTVWGEAKNIKMNLSVGEYEDASLVDIQTNDVDFGWTLSNYAKATSKTPLVIKISDNVPNNRHIRLLLNVTCEGSQQDISYEFSIVVNNLIKIGGLIASDMTLTADKNYLVSSNLAIPEGVTLTVEPGTTIRFGKDVGFSNNGNLIMKGLPGKMIVLTSLNPLESWGKMNFRNTGNWDVQVFDTLEYCRIENSAFSQYYAVKNCVFINSFGTGSPFGWVPNGGYLYCCNIENCSNINFKRHYNGSKEKLNWLNLINNDINITNDTPEIEDFDKANYFNTGGKPLFFNGATTPVITKPSTTAYMGTSSIDIANTLIWDIDYDYGFEQVDLTNLRKTPYSEAHGIVWKVVVNGKDAQDEYEDLAPLGVGRHKFEVYFNRPMNKAKIPQISFGVREPFTQNIVAEDGAWNDEGSIYTAYVTISGKTQSDGVNRIYVYGAEDDEFFECPYEKTRFNINIQAAGSMATGFMADAGLGKVTLTWNNENNDFDDAMGFNVYRYTVNGETADTVCINKEIVDIEATEYIDYDVTPGETYYYFYRVLSTDLKEYDVSNVVAATPTAGELGDANGSGDVDVADVITTVNYAAGMEPKPFIFEAADMNADQMIDILDIIGIIQKILNPGAAAPVMVENVATYTIEDGVLYVESPVDLAGVQVQLSLSEELRVKSEEFATAADLDGFEHASAWLSDNDYLFLAFNMNGKTLSAGKHALLHIGDAQIASIRLSNAMGGNVPVEAGTTNIEQVLTGASTIIGIYNLHGQRVAVSADQLNLLPKGVYIVDGKKVVKWK